MEALRYQNKVNELNSKFPNLKLEVVKNWDGTRLEIKAPNSDKAKTLKEMFRDFNFTF
jgi:hydroxymethylpyrimidine pyrophosphatase-like HAD family hydrolase